MPRLLAPFLVLALVCTCSKVHASVIVFANQTEDPVIFAVIHPDKKIQAYRIAADDVLPVTPHGSMSVRYQVGNRIVDRPLAPNSVCSFVNKGQLDLVEQRFGDVDSVATEKPSVGSSSNDSKDKVGTFPVMILVDEDEPAVRRLWESRLRSRLDEASKIFERHCRMRFKVVAVDTWKSNNSITDFSLSLREFERKVPLKSSARLAIGFTSQYRKPEHRRVHLGGTRGPLYSHLLVREWSQHISESERLEVLVHELGHVLGAVHSGESTSVMRPIVGDRQSRARSFLIGFDPLNTMALNLFSEQVRSRNARRLTDFSPNSRMLLAKVYRKMQNQVSGDTSAVRYLALVQMAEQRADMQRGRSLTAATRSVVRAVTRAAVVNQARPTAALSSSTSETQLDGDELADYYVRTAAREARRYPKHIAGKAFCLGLAVALHKSNNSGVDSTFQSLYQRYENSSQRRRRLTMLGKPTIHGREDLLQHFATSAALCVTIGDSGAESIAVLKEISDSRGDSGFSFADLAADTAGIEMAKRLEQSQLSLDDLANSFAARHFLLHPKTLPKEMTYEEFQKAFGTANTPRFRQRNEALQRQIFALPGYGGQKGS